MCVSERHRARETGGTGFAKARAVNSPRGVLTSTPGYAPPGTVRSARRIIPVNLLWTGGWDSTFRLLDLVVRQGRRVTPHYIVNPDRPGTLHELHAMRSIRTRVRQNFPDCAGLIEPTLVTLLDSIAEDAELTQKFERLKSRAYLGSQYDWLARHIRQQGIRELELCIHADDRAEVFMRGQVEHVVEAEGGDYWRIRREAEADDIGLFANFRFPILNLTKTEMRRRAHATGLDGLMSLTWFCHTPIDGRPCGVCNPCRYTIDEGLADRLPGRALLRHRFGKHLKLTSKVSGAFYKTLARVAKPFIQRERKRHCVAVT